MFKRFGITTLALFVVGFGSATSSRVYAQTSEAVGDQGN